MASLSLFSDKHISMSAKLQQSVQEERVAKILHGSRKLELLNISDSEEPAMHHAAVTVTKTATPDNRSIAKHVATITSQSQTTALVNHSSRTNTITSHTYSPTQTTPFLNHSSHTNTTSHVYSPAQTTSLLNRSSHTHTLTSHTYSPTHNTSAFNHSTGKHTNTSHTDHNSHTTLQNPFITPPRILDLDTYQTPLSCDMSPPKSFTKLLQLADDDCENVPLTSSPSPPNTGDIGNSNWESFTSHFTQEFEWLKAEVDGLRNEVKSLRRTVRELKVIDCWKSDSS